MPSFGNLVPLYRWRLDDPATAALPERPRLGGGAVLVRYQPCAGSCHGGHTTWQCVACDAIRYAPGVGAGCRLLDASAFKR
jgi:hypothetical protein